MDSLNSYGYGHHKKKKKIVVIIKEVRVSQRRERKEKEFQKKLWIYFKRKKKLGKIYYIARKNQYNYRLNSYLKNIFTLRIDLHIYEII